MNELIGDFVSIIQCQWQSVLCTTGLKSYLSKAHPKVQSLILKNHTTVLGVIKSHRHQLV